jgi:glycosyltransferase involved in cell wall biosynthesis
MKIGIIGTRGFPEVQGGLETHCMELYTRIAQNYDALITVYRRKPYLNSKNRDVRYPNIRFIDLNVPRSKNLETFLHAFMATVHAMFQGYDIIHFHNTGPGFFIPLLKLSGSKIIFTYHNISYTQKKWGGIARTFLTLSEKISLKNSDYVIFISEILKSEMLVKYQLQNYMGLPNGVNIPERSVDSGYIESLGLEKYRYIISVGRFLEEKGFDYLIRAYARAGIKDYKLVLVGDTDYPTVYSDKLKSLARENGVVLTGFIKGENLKQIYSYARLFIISSFSEGLPIVLLEAMSFNIDVLASNIPANYQIGIEKNDYFAVGDEDDLKEKLLLKISEKRQRNFVDFLKLKFNWDLIAKETYSIYKNLLVKDET